MSAYPLRLIEALKRKGTPVCVGLDPRFEQLPPAIIARARAAHADPRAQAAAAYEEFCIRVIDVIAPLVGVVKPQAAFFEEWGPPGMQALCGVMAHARRAGLVVIGDAKRGDIGTTAEAYARAWLAGADPSRAPMSADALTVNPYLGTDALEPFVRLAAERGAGLYVLVRTSNPGAGTFQDLAGSDGAPLYRHVASLVEKWAEQTRGGLPYGAVGAVVGATYPRDIAQLREAMPHAPFLVPGYGSQGAGAQDVAAALGPAGDGAVINNSRGLIFAYERPEFKERFGPDRWEEAVAAATRQMIEELASQTTAGRLQ
jgi:orotidine-5'-phosphate decarboxylase